MHTYTQTFPVEQNHLDELNHVNNIKYVEWIQDVSKKHWFKATTKVIRDDMVWVVKNHNITYSKSAVLGDTIEVFTYIKDTKGPLSIRVVEIKNNKTGQILVKACTEWCLLDAKTFKPKRVPESIQNLFAKT
ncbi:acyl-CoA thioesterase [Flagellimonas pacifica]|uniref:Acyl-CoA thioester hydrolase n=1 Tax=Flagellimonas pacifica TaxID=1247520 RepID=A0A285MVI8_9FLAO|nr:acyl-ACP thioesterase domain-containing protein [Allomuricauda parva]SNZ00703.1 acyl-CoA thioester hydrolase [Allomuricauda parva]